ncbi:hypothetical protein [Nocardioides sp. URHA0020]|uniref:hypothetical protein n=1 Tax=Nocardioides sp. URHA0020 TaxID=1380392 RepID=UPI00048EF0D6|nr:hypothetical protein [Nocardioides sp. URHA0020]
MMDRDGDLAADAGARRGPDEVPAGTPPVDDIIRGTRVARRRKRTAGLLGLAVALACAAVIQQAATRDHGAGAGAQVAATPLDLPTSGWSSGDPAMTAAAGGTLAVDEDGCVYLAGAADLQALTRAGSADQERRRSYWVWPAGYTATVDGDARLTIYSYGSVVAHGGDVVEVGGASTYVSAGTADPCLPKPGTDEVFIVMSSVRVAP